MGERCAVGTILAAWVALLLGLAPAAVASTKCLCNNGTIVQSMDDGEGVCEDACSELGGGRVWTPDDADGDDDGADAGRERVEERRPHRR